MFSEFIVRSRGFTLLELIVVLSAVAMLFSILWHATEEAPAEIPIGPWMQHPACIPSLSIHRDKALLPARTEDAFGGRHPNRTVKVAFVNGHALAR